METRRLMPSMLRMLPSLPETCHRLWLVDEKEGAIFLWQEKRLKATRTYTAKVILTYYLKSQNVCRVNKKKYLCALKISTYNA